jgi:prepilin-type N-terminal cleavage/methylation domain-containing protein
MRAGAGRRGVTLLELLAVIVIISMLLGFAVFYMQSANRDLGVVASVNHVAGLFRLAHQHARTTSSPAWVVLDTRGNSAYVLLKETVGEWHLEPDAKGGGTGAGAFGRDAAITGGKSVPGRVGQGLELSGSGSVRCPEVPLQDPSQGIAIELWFLRLPGRSRGILARVGAEIEIAAETDGQISARVGALSVRSGNQLRLPLDTWCHVQMIFSGRDLRLLLNRIPAGIAVGAGAWTPGQPLVVGDPKSGVTGVVDEIRVGLILPQERYTLPSEVTFELPAGFPLPADGAVVVGYDAEGRLDPAFGRAFSFGIKSSADRRGITISQSGSVQR